MEYAISNGLATEDAYPYNGDAGACDTAKAATGTIRISTADCRPNSACAAGTPCAEDEAQILAWLQVQRAGRITTTDTARHARDMHSAQYTMQRAT